jgi:uncharacterized Tic20 family protein
MELHWNYHDHDRMCLFTSFKAARLQIHVNFHENFVNVFECVILWSNQKKASYTLSIALRNHVNYQKMVFIILLLKQHVSRFMLILIKILKMYESNTKLNYNNTQKEIMCIVQKAKSGSACGIDEIPYDVLKKSCCYRDSSPSVSTYFWLQYNTLCVTKGSFLPNTERPKFW